MRFPVLFACLLFAVCAGFVTGCVTQQPSQCPCIDCPCDGDCCPDCCPCLDGGCCVDGACSPVTEQAEATTESPDDVPASADAEQLREQQAAEAEQLTAQRSKPREGVFHCMRCRKPHVGAAWHTLHTPTGGAATWLCVKCWNQSTHAERMAYMNAYFDILKSPPSHRRAFIVAMNALGSESTPSE